MKSITYTPHAIDNRIARAKEAIQRDLEAEAASATHYGMLYLSTFAAVVTFFMVLGF